MNDWDRNNLEFLLKSSPETLKQFLLESDQDNLRYAMELLLTAMEEAIEYQIDSDSESNPGDLYPEANKVLQKFRLNK